MARPAKFSTDQILDAASDLLVHRGPGALTVTAVAEQLGAPSGSIYHRFSSRDVLVASLWLRAVERFHDAIDRVLAPSPAQPISAAQQAVANPVLDVAVEVVDWSRRSRPDAQILLLHRAADLVHGEWPNEFRERNDAQNARVTALVSRLCADLGATSTEDRRRVVFAAIDIPYGAVREPLSRGEAPGAHLTGFVRDAVAGVLAPLMMETDT